MTRILLTGLAAAALLQPQSALASKAPYTCGTGRLLDVELVTDVVSNGTTSVTTTKRNKHGERKEYTHTTPAEHTEKTYFVTIELDDMRYVARSSGNLPWNFNPTRMVINDPIGMRGPQAPDRDATRRQDLQDQHRPGVTGSRKSRNRER